LFLAEARANLTVEAAADRPSKWTKEELDGLEKALRDHETWLNDSVEKQKLVKMDQDPVISTTEMKARAKTLETHLQRLVRRKTPKPKKTSSATPSATPTPTSSEADSNSSTVAAEAKAADTTEVPLKLPIDDREEL